MTDMATFVRPGFPVLRGKEFDLQAFRQVQQYYADLDKFHKSVGDDESVVGGCVGAGGLLCLSSFARKRAVEHASLRESHMSVRRINIRPELFDSGFCYLSFVKPLWVCAAADFCGFAPELDTLLSAPKAWFDIDILRDKFISQVQEGCLHIDVKQGLGACEALKKLAHEAKHWPRGSLASMLRTYGPENCGAAVLNLGDRMGFVESVSAKLQPVVVEFTQPPGYCYRDLLYAGSRLSDSLGAFPTLHSLVSADNSQFTFSGLNRCNLIAVRDDGSHVYKVSGRGNFLPRIAGMLSGYEFPTGSLGRWVVDRLAEGFIVPEVSRLTLEHVCGSDQGILSAGEGFNCSQKSTISYDGAWARDHERGLDGDWERKVQSSVASWVLHEEQQPVSREVPLGVAHKSVDALGYNCKVTAIGLATVSYVVGSGESDEGFWVSFDPGIVQSFIVHVLSNRAYLVMTDCEVERVQGSEVLSLTIQGKCEVWFQFSVPYANFVVTSIP